MIIFLSLAWSRFWELESRIVVDGVSGVRELMLLRAQQLSLSDPAFEIGELWELKLSYFELIDPELELMNPELELMNPELDLHDRQKERRLRKSRDSVEPVFKCKPLDSIPSSCARCLRSRPEVRCRIIGFLPIDNLSLNFGFKKKMSSYFKKVWSLHDRFF